MRSPGKILLYAAILLFFLIRTQKILSSSEFRIFLLTSDKGIFLSEDSAKSWKKFNQGLPACFIPVKMRNDDHGNLFLLTRDSGIYTFNTNRNIWEDINSKEFLEPLFIQKPDKYRRISAFAVDKDNNLILATGHAIFRKETNKPWIKISDYNQDYYFTALGINNNRIYAGTTNKGIFILSGSGKFNISSNLPKESYSENYFLNEEIAQIEFDGKDPNIIYTGMNFGGGVYMSGDNGRSWTSLCIPIQEESLFDIFDIKIMNDSLFVSTSAGIYKLDKDNKWQYIPLENITKILSSKQQNLSVFIIDKSGKIPSLFYKLNDYKLRQNPGYTEKIHGRKAIYANIYSLNKKLMSYIDIIKKCSLNAIVIDLKDDWGAVCFSSRNKTALEIGAVKNYADIKKTLDILKKENIYAIARMVVFKDKYIYNAYNHKYAIWDKYSKSPWKGNPKEFWNDPYSDFIRDYNIEIAGEIENLGFDEIQFDYIRFPSDGPISRCYYRHKKNDDIYKSEILAYFLEQAKSRINIPISVDIYGFSAWFRTSHLIGQDAERFAEISDILCPMVYPSHYGRNFYLNIPAASRPYKIVLNSVKRAAKISMGNAIIRPYLQAFRLMSPTWGPDYIKSQAKAALESGCDGYTFWNAGGDYDMVCKAIADKNTEPQ